MYLVGELGATLSLQGKQRFDSDLDSSGQKFGQLGSVADSVTSGIEQGFDTGAVAISAAAAAVIGLTTETFKAGLSYNSLQQTSRAALTTLLGGAAAANAQMDQLDAFARTSPFAKQVFISAQQQLLGFGFTAQSVVPTLDAIQNTVAAIGGSDDDISQLTDALAKVKAEGQITSRTLIEFGNEGVDAASLIGSQMGKTGQQIRDEITNGTLDANVAITALVAGMDEKFGGAAAGVKQTIAGTVDAISAAARDIGGDLAEPFVAQSGGGLFVTWGNQVADVMRAAEAQIIPIVGILVDKAGPELTEVSTLLDKIEAGVEHFSLTNLETQFAGFSKYVPILAGVGGAIVATAAGTLKAIPIVGELVGEMNPLAAAIIAVAAASPEMRKALEDLYTATKPIDDAVVDLAKHAGVDLDHSLSDIAGWIEQVASNKQGIADVGKTIDDLGQYAPEIAAVAGALLSLGPGLPILSSLGIEVNPFVGGLIALTAASPDLRNSLGDVLKALAPLEPLIPELAKDLSEDLNAILPTTATLITGVATVATPLLSVIGKINPALLIAVGGFAGLVKLQGPLTLFFDGVLGKALTATDAIGAQGIKLVEAGGLWTGFGEAVVDGAAVAEGAVSTLGEVTDFLSGPWGLVLGAASLAVGAFALNGVDTANQAVLDFTQTLDDNTGALTKNSREAALAALQKPASAGGKSAAQEYSAIGGDAGDLVSAALGDPDAVAKVKALVAAYGTSLGAGGPSTGLAGRAGAGPGHIQFSQTAGAILPAVAAESTTVQSAKTTETQVLQVSGAAKTQLDAYDKSVKALNTDVKTNGVTTDKTSQSYKDQQSEIDKIGKSAKSYITTVQNQYQSTTKTKQATDDSILSLDKVAATLGITGKAVDPYVAKLLGIPTSVVTQVNVETSTAENNLSTLSSHLTTFYKTWSSPAVQKALASVPVDIRAPSIFTTNAHGNIYFADGGENHVAQIAPAGANRIWAEPETGGEAYIPLAGAKRQRSTAILETVADQFGLELTAKGAKKYADGGISGGTPAPAAGSMVQVINKSGVKLSDLIDMRINLHDTWTQVDLDTGV